MRCRLASLLLFSACAHAGADDEVKKSALPVVVPAELPPDPPAPPAAPPVLITGATIMTAAGPIHSPGWIYLASGRIAALGAGEAPAVEGARRIEARGGFVTPGIIDTHSHLGVYPMPYMQAHEDGNEAVAATTPDVWAEHGFWPQDPAIWRATSGGVTTIQVLPGSANLIGGCSFVAKLRPAASARLMRFPGARQGLKMACGENPKRVYAERGGPATRMGNAARFRAAFQAAREYQRKWQKYQRDLAHWQKHGPEEDEVDPPEPPERDLGMETLVRVLDGEMWVHNHCYRADEMHLMLDLAREFGFTIRSFHHAVEAYKLADRLAAEAVAVSTWSDWWGFKMEAYDGIPQNAALVSKAGARAVIHSDSGTELRHLNQEAAKARAAAQKVGLSIDDNETLRWITANPAWVLGVDGQTGSLETGKMADVVLWDGNPFSVYSRASKVWIDGHLIWDREAPPRRSDFELGTFSGTEVKP